MQLELSGRGAGSVEAVSDDWNAEAVFRGGVNAKLVGSASDWNKFHSRLSVFNAERLPVGDAEFSVDGVVDLKRAVFDVEAEG